MVDLPPDDEDRPLTDTLRKRWASGQISSAIVQEIASGAERQGASGMADLPQAGSGGRHAHNLQRSMLKIFGAPPAAADFTWVRIPTSHGMAVHPVFLPHQFFSRIFHNDVDVWQQHVRGPDGLAKNFGKRSEVHPSSLGTRD